MDSIYLDEEEGRGSVISILLWIRKGDDKEASEKGSRGGSSSTLATRIWEAVAEAAGSSAWEEGKDFDFEREAVRRSGNYGVGDRVQALQGAQ